MRAPADSIGTAQGDVPADSSRIGDRSRLVALGALGVLVGCQNLAGLTDRREDSSRSGQAGQQAAASGRSEGGAGDAGDPANGGAPGGASGAGDDAGGQSGRIRRPAGGVSSATTEAGAGDHPDDSTVSGSSGEPGRSQGETGGSTSAAGGVVAPPPPGTGGAGVTVTPSGGVLSTGGTSTSSGGLPATGGASGGQPSGGTSVGGSSATGGLGPPGGSTSTTGGQDGGGVVVDGNTATGGAATGTGGTTTGGSGPTMGGSTGTGGSAVVAAPLVVTSTSGAYWVTPATPIAATGSANVTVDDAAAAQTWEGFGTAFNEMGWDCLMMLSEADRTIALNLIFGANGTRFTWGLIPMGATDYAMDRYTDDEVPSGSTDPTMASFSIARDQEKLIPFVRAAQAVKPDLRFWASPWTPPTWMKDGPFNDESPFDGGTMKGDAGTLGALAQYFVRFVQAYAAEGIDIELVSPQNEPGYSGTYPTCGWAPADYATFVGEHLGPALSVAGLDAKIMLGTFHGGTGDDEIIGTVMGDATARSYIQVLGYQWGMLSMVSSAKQYGLPIWQSQHQGGNYPWATPFNDEIAPNDDAYAVESWQLIRQWINAGVSSYDTWNAVLDTKGVGIDSSITWPQNALLTVDTTAGTLNITPAYYVLRHCSQFVDPGAKVVATSGGEALAFKNPNGSIVTVMYNAGAARAYIVSVGGMKWQFDMPSEGWATVVVSPAG